MNRWRIHRPTLALIATAAWLAISLGPFSHGQSAAWAQKPKPDATKNKNDKNDKNDKPGKGDTTQPTVTMEIAKAEGKLEGAQQAILKISTSDNKEVFLKTDNDTVIRFKAEADPAWLAPGLFVRFTATFDQNGKATTALKELEVFSPIMSPRLSPEQQREQTPGIHQEGKAPPDGAKGLFGENGKAPAANTPKGKPANKKEPPAPMAGQAFRVVGKLAGMQNNVLNVLADRPVQIELDPAAKITVMANDLSSVMSMATKGDNVEVSGLRNPTQPEIIVAEQIDLKAAKKLTQAVPVKRGGKGSSRDKDLDGKDQANKDKTGKDKNDAKKPVANKTAADKKNPK